MENAFLKIWFVQSVQSSRKLQTASWIFCLCKSFRATQLGFGITYDFRKLQNPSVRILCNIARWSVAPERKKLFMERCKACKTCVPPGWKFWATKAAMDAFFLITPPTCKTYLMTSFDENCENVVCFEPPQELITGAIGSADSDASPLLPSRRYGICCR